MKRVLLLIPGLVVILTAIVAEIVMQRRLGCNER